MPRYRFTYVLETPITARRDVTFVRRGFPVSLIFSARIDQDHIRLQAVAEGPNWLAANEAAMDSVVSPVLDAISLHQEAPAMLQELLYVVKAEVGIVRRAVIIEHSREREVIVLEEPETREVQGLLDREAAVPHAVMRWLRYCYRPVPVLERFVYSWLAFENRAGTRQVARQCATCGANQPAIPRLNRDEAFRVLSEDQPAMSREEFDNLFRRWWTELRNPIFHGGRPVTTAMRTQAKAAMDLYRTAVERDLQRQAAFRLAHSGRAPRDGLLQLDIHHFVEFQIPDGGVEFASPPDVDILAGLRQQMPLQVIMLNYDDAEHW